MRSVLAIAFCLALLAPAASRADDEAERLGSLLGVRPGATLADIGAGDGRFALAFAAGVGTEGRVYATELELEQLDAIRAAAEAAGLSNLEVVRAETVATGLASACCDAILLRHVYHHLTEPADVSRDLLRALKPGGVLVVVDFPPTWYLRPFAPHGVGAERSGHGLESSVALRELRDAGFEERQRIEPWTERWLGPDPYALVLRKPGTTPDS